MCIVLRGCPLSPAKVLPCDRCVLPVPLLECKRDFSKADLLRSNFLNCYSEAIEKEDMPTPATFDLEKNIPHIRDSVF